MRDAFGHIRRNRNNEKKEVKMAAAQHQQSFSFFCFKNIEIIQKMDKVECVDWSTQSR